MWTRRPCGSPSGRRRSGTRNWTPSTPGDGRPTNRSTPPLLTGDVEAHLAERSAGLLDRVLAAAASGYPRVRLRRTTFEGPAHKVLTERSAAADLLVVGARRRDGLVGLELGRIAHRALHHASCPVAVVPQRGPEATEGDR
ncbi:universal stress protein [Streptomyces sp. NPDC048018]|uniref:universal stress protein n=1 Tax=Streptomyces sp. NPDC048018 TaxID=3365499 RepID=UPI00371DBA56